MEQVERVEHQFVGARRRRSRPADGRNWWCRRRSRWTSSPSISAASTGNAAKRSASAGNFAVQSRPLRVNSCTLPPRDPGHQPVAVVFDLVKPLRFRPAPGRRRSPAAAWDRPAAAPSWRRGWARCGPAARSATRGASAAPAFFAVAVPRPDRDRRRSRRARGRWRRSSGYRPRPRSPLCGTAASSRSLIRSQFSPRRRGCLPPIRTSAHLPCSFSPSSTNLRLPLA